jgi:hypothetical protein
MNFEALRILIIRLGLLLLIPMALLIVTWLFPVYLLPNQQTARHFAFSPPTRTQDRPYDRMTEQEKGSMRDGGAKERLLEAMKNQPAELPYEHSYMGSMGETDFNILGWLTALVFVGWLGYAGLIGYHAYMSYRDVQREAEAKKKKALPFDVRRMGSKRRSGSQ